MITLEAIKKAKHDAKRGQRGVIWSAMAAWDAMAMRPQAWSVPQAARATTGHKASKARKRRRKMVQASRRANR